MSTQAQPTNLAEGLAAEIKRVTELKAQYETLLNMPGVNVRPAIFMMDAALREAIEANGSNDVIRVMRAYESLKGFEK